MKQLNINEVLNLEGIKIIDVREPFEYQAGTINGAINIPMLGLLMNPNEFLNKEDEYYIMCKSGMRSQQVCHNLESEGYQVINLAGGYMSFNK